MILIGKNNAISAALSATASAAYSHREIDKINFDQSNEVIITAMDPQYKSSMATLKFEKKIAQLIPKNKKVVYISTLRLIDDASKNSFYCRNKKNIELLLSEYFTNLLILRFPAVISTEKQYLSNFQRIFSNNLSKNIINFDVPKESKYNFITQVDIRENFESLIKKNRCDVRNIYNKRWYTAEEVVSFYKVKSFKIEVRYGTKMKSYSSIKTNCRISKGFAIKDSTFELGMLDVEK